MMEVRDRGELSTEGVHPDGAQLDRLPTLEAVDLFLAADRRALDAVAGARAEIAAAVDLVAKRLADGGRLFYAGAGTSGRLAALDAAECPPTFQSDPRQVQALVAGGARALTRAVEGAEDDAGAAAAELRARGLDARDVVLGISAGGTTPFVRGALAFARETGAATVFLACVPRAQCPDEADVSIRVETGPELLAGSTRLKAGTATKLVLNTISTLVMARLGKVYEGLMVDVDTRASAKLVDRGERLVMRLAVVGRERARALLVAAEGQVKLAVLMERAGLDLADVAGARARLASAGGDLRRALG